MWSELPLGACMMRTSHSAPERRRDSGGFANADRYGPAFPGGAPSGGPAGVSAGGPAGTSTGATSAALPGSSGAPPVDTLSRLLQAVGCRVWGSCHDALKCLKGGVRFRVLDASGDRPKVTSRQPGPQSARRVDRPSRLP